MLRKGPLRLKIYSVFGFLGQASC